MKAKAEVGYHADYYEKMMAYACIFSGPASPLDPQATARVVRPPEPEGDSVFNYTDTASDRAGIGALLARLAQDTIAIFGLGGSGGYVVDFVAKTPVREIRLFDGDAFLHHNAFRAPGAPSIDGAARGSH